MKRICLDFKKFSGYCVASAKAQLESEVANSYLNWLWWIIEPLCTMAIYSVIFGTVFGMKTENYAAFIFIGVSLYDFFSKGVKGSVKTVKRNKHIVTKVYVPKYMLVLSDLLVCGFKLVLCLAVAFAMMAASGIRFTPNVLFLIPILINLYLFTFAACVFLAHFGVFIEDLANVVNIALKFLFYFTGIFYSIREKFPPQYAKIILRCYPASKLIDMARDCCMYGKPASVAYLATLAVASLCAALVGMHVIYRNENSYVKLI